MLKNFENFTPDEIYHLENAIILSTLAHVSAITEFYKKLKFETSSAKAKKKIIQSIKELFESGDESSNIQVIDSTNVSDKNKVLDNDRVLDLINENDERKQELKDSFIDFKEDLFKKFEGLQHSIDLYNKMFDSMFNLFDYEQLGIIEKFKNMQDTNVYQLRESLKTELKILPTMQGFKTACEEYLNSL